MPASCVAAPKRHQRQQTERMMRYRDVWQETGLVFDRGDGTMLHPNTLDGASRREVARLGLRRIRLHDLRHTCARLALRRRRSPR